LQQKLFDIIKGTDDEKVFKIDFTKPTRIGTCLTGDPLNEKIGVDLCFGCDPSMKTAPPIAPIPGGWAFSSEDDCKEPNQVTNNVTQDNPTINSAPENAQDSMTSTTTTTTTTTKNPLADESEKEEKQVDEGQHEAALAKRENKRTAEIVTIIDNLRNHTWTAIHSLETGVEGRNPNVTYLIWLCL
jgi:hypothetical protein